MREGAVQPVGRSLAALDDHRAADNAAVGRYLGQSRRTVRMAVVGVLVQAESVPGEQQYHSGCCGGVTPPVRYLQRGSGEEGREMRPPQGYLAVGNVDVPTGDGPPRQLIRVGDHMQPSRQQHCA